MYGIQPPVYANAYDVVFVGALAVAAHGTQDVVKPVVIGKYRAAVAIAPEGFGWIETRGGAMGQGTDFAVSAGAAECLRCVGDDEQVFFLGNRVDGLVVGGLAKEIDRDDGSWLQPSLAPHVCDRLAQVVAIDVERRRVHVHEDRRRARQQHGFCRGRVGEARKEDRVFGPQIHRQERHEDGVGSA